MNGVSRQIIELLARHPQGLTATEIAKQIGGRPVNVASRASKMAAYGLIGRRFEPSQDAPPKGLKAIYFPKANQENHDEGGRQDQGA